MESFNEDTLREEFDIWYKNQKEMNPYIMRDWFLSKLSQYRQHLIEFGEKEKMNSETGDGYSEGWNEAIEAFINVIRETDGTNHK